MTAQKALTRPILVVEDDDILRRLAMRQLRKLGYDARGCANGREAVNMLNSEHFAIILMDVQMPVMDGVEATDAIKELQRLKQLATMPIIAMTANSDENRWRKAGMDDYLFKPVELASLRDMLNKWLGVKSAEL